MDDLWSPRRSVDTMSSSEYPIIPFIGPFDAALITSHILAYVAGLASLTVKSTKETSTQEKLKDVIRPKEKYQV